ncbi:AbrB/MazE/SpoVT family DNA-binding domain-containing protein [Halorubrum rubrum]|uniref:AbrB/MazE/SpoVT family DNA-binding domain-containing protein n=1 Tax=Halorubrum rubrum TaxID=1126240 RepID=A0ABD5QYY7_9EURY|nr:AbrB/MazE/SpoVT family DNA-binding domain-containing protein [Halorubrum rubrum]
MSQSNGYKAEGITRFMAEGRRIQEGDGSFTVTIPRSLAMEWDLEHGDDLLFTAEEGSTKATIHKPGSEGGFSVEVADD